MACPRFYFFVWRSPTNSQFMISSHCHFLKSPVPLLFLILEKNSSVICLLIPETEESFVFSLCHLRGSSSCLFNTFALLLFPIACTRVWALWFWLGTISITFLLISPLSISPTPVFPPSGCFVIVIFPSGNLNNIPHLTALSCSQVKVPCQLCQNFQDLCLASSAVLSLECILQTSHAERLTDLWIVSRGFSCLHVLHTLLCMECSSLAWWTSAVFWDLTQSSIPFLFPFIPLSKMLSTTSF